MSLPGTRPGLRGEPKDTPAPKIRLAAYLICDTHTLSNWSSESSCILIGYPGYAAGARMVCIATCLHTAALAWILPKIHEYAGAQAGLKWSIGVME